VNALHLFIGEEDLLMEEGVRALVEELLSPDARDLNLDVLDAAEVPGGEITTRLDTLPFFGDRRVVVVKNLDALHADEQRLLEDYLGRGLPPTVAVFTARSLDRRGRLFRACQKLGTVHPCDPPGARQAPEWAQRFAARLGKRLPPQAAHDLVQLAGTGLRTLALEVDKLAAYVGERREITAEDVDAAASRLSEAGAFALTDAIGERNRQKAMRALEALLQSDHPLVVLAMIAGQYRRLARTVSSGARTETELAAAIGVHPYAARKLLGAARNYRPADFPGIFALLEETDRAIKSTGQPALAVETLVVQLCGGAVVRPAAGDAR
jgi:DNA polymerase-3 subunit delta